METQIVLSTGNTITIVVSFALLLAWAYKLISKKFDKVELDLKEFRKESQENYNKLDNKIDHLGERVGKVENRLTAIETILPYVSKTKVIRIEEHHEDEPKEN
ncbi:MAG: hypothetical protein H6620_10810 [Halobacteriovoraceae bacterium]|nr:hypothetical protein [Halobacteriovoraceae bacterium]